MPTVTIAKTDYDEVLYPALAELTSDSMAELELADSLLTKMEALGSDGAMALESASLDLTDGEAALLLQRIEREMRRKPTQRMRALLSLVRDLSQVRAARVAALDLEIESKQRELAELSTAVNTTRTRLDALNRT